MARVRKAVKQGRVRVRRGLVDNKSKRLVQEKLEEVAEVMQLIADSQAELKVLEAQLDELMRGSKIESAESVHAVAEMKRPQGRSSTYIDPKKFYDAVPTEDDFFAGISVGITDAKKILTEKEFNKIAETVPGKIKDPVLSVKLK